MTMLGDATIALLNECPFRAEALRKECILPLASIYWEDEMPRGLDLFKLPTDQQNMVWRLFCIRMKVWDGEELSSEDSLVWEAARAVVPDWALFQRLELSNDDREARCEIEKQIYEEIAEVFGSADRLEIAEQGNGLQQFSATFDLTKSSVSDAPEERSEMEASEPWWRKWWRRLTRSSSSGD